MAVKAVFFDVGETLVDETRAFERMADELRVPRLTFFGLVGGAIALGEPHARVFERLGTARPAWPGYDRDDFYPDAIPCLGELRLRGFRVGIVGNQPQACETFLHEAGVDVDCVGSSERWGAAKPAPAFFARVAEEAGCEAHEIAYVGDRVDNDVLPALAAGMVAVHIRRGPWGFLHEPPPEAIRVRSLDELPEALGV